MVLAILLIISARPALAKSVKVENIEIIVPEIVYGDDVVDVTAVITPGDAADQRIAWSINPKKAGKITRDGKLTLGKVKEPTEVTIIAKSRDKGASAEYTLMVYSHVNTFANLEEFLDSFENYDSFGGAIESKDSVELTQVHGDVYDLTEMRFDEHYRLSISSLAGTGDVFKIEFISTDTLSIDGLPVGLAAVVFAVIQCAGVSEPEEDGVTVGRDTGILGNRKKGTIVLYGLEYSWTKDARKGLTLTITKP
jgi:hypothetical protein